MKNFEIVYVNNYFDNKKKPTHKDFQELQKQINKLNKTYFIANLIKKGVKVCD